MHPTSGVLGEGVSPYVGWAKASPDEERSQWSHFVMPSLDTASALICCPSSARIDAPQACKWPLSTRIAAVLPLCRSHEANLAQSQEGQKSHMTITPFQGTWPSEPAISLGTALVSNSLCRSSEKATIRTSEA
jgi:hypothetical protein